MTRFLSTLLLLLAVTALASGDKPGSTNVFGVDVQVRFIEITQPASRPTSLDWLLSPGLPPKLAAAPAPAQTSFTDLELEAIFRSPPYAGRVKEIAASSLTTQDGQTGTLKVVTEYTYATDVALKRVDAPSDGRPSDDRRSGLVAVPSGFQTREAGIILSVVPRLQPDSEFLALDIRSEMVDTPAWKDYHAVYTAPDGKRQTLVLPQPIFPACRQSTRIVVPNGAVTAIGGTTTQRRVPVRHKIPVLGYIPLVGRLFQTTREQIENRHLVILITARVLTAGPRPIPFLNRKDLKPPHP